MGYNKEKVKVLSPKDGYDILSINYKKYHKKLDSWDNGIFMRFLPRNLEQLRIVDLGSGDGRLAKYFVGKSISKYLAVDISEKMLNKGNNWYEKAVFDLNSIFPINDNNFDIALSFFVLLHLENINNFFQEVYRILSKGGMLVLLHHNERQLTEFSSKNGKFRIKSNVYRFENIEKIAQYCFFNIDYVDLIDNNVNIGRLYCFTK